MRVSCPNCSAALNAPESALGKRVQCVCGHSFVLSKPAGSDSAIPGATQILKGLALIAAAVVLSVISSLGASALFANSSAVKVETPRDPRIEILEARVAKLSDKLAAQTQFIDQLKSVPPKPETKPLDVAALQAFARQLKTHEGLLRTLGNAIDDIHERFRIGFDMQFRILTPAERTEFISAVSGLDKSPPTLTIEQFATASQKLGGVGFTCLFLRQIDEIRDCLARDFDAMDDPIMARTIRGEKPK